MSAPPRLRNHTWPRPRTSIKGEKELLKFFLRLLSFPFVIEIDNRDMLFLTESRDGRIPTGRVLISRPGDGHGWLFRYAITNT